MKLSAILNPKLIFLNGKLNNKKQIIDFMIDAIIHENHVEYDKNTAIKLVNKREAIGGTEFPNGVCVPHARLDIVNNLTTVVYIPEKPVKGDVVKIEVFVLFIIGKAATNLYLKSLSSVIGIKHDIPLFEKLKEASTPEMFIETLSKNNIKVKKETTVSDISSYPALTINQNSTVGNAADIFYKQKLSYLPVVDDDNKLVGEITVLDLIRASTPNYELLTDDLKYLSSFDPFEALLEVEDTTLIKKVMHKPIKHLSHNTTIVETAIIMAQKNIRQLPITDDEDKVVGVISAMDILSKIIRG